MDKDFNNFIVADQINDIIEYSVEARANKVARDKQYRGIIQSVNGNVADILLQNASTPIPDVKIKTGIKWLVEGEDVYMTAINGSLNNLIINTRVLDLDLLYGVDVSDFKHIETFQDYSEWNNVNAVGTVEEDIVNKKYRGKGVKHKLEDLEDTYMIEKTVSLDLTEFPSGVASTTDDIIGISFYVSDVSAIDSSYGIALYLYTNTYSDYYYYNFEDFHSTITQGWNNTFIAKSSFSSGGSPDWSNINAIELSYYGYAGFENEYITYGLITLIQEIDYGGGGGGVPQPLDTTDSPTFAGLTLTGLTADRVVYANGTKKLATSNVTSTNINYLAGQDQSVLSSSVPTFRALNLSRTSNGNILLHFDHNASSGNSANYTELRLDSYVNATNLCNKISFYNRGSEMASIRCNTTSFYLTPEIAFHTSALALKIDDSQNLLINSASTPTNGVGSLAIKKGTSPSASTADQIAIYATTDANTTLGIMTEATVATESITPDSTLLIRVNGSLYKIPMELQP